MLLRCCYVSLLLCTAGAQGLGLDAGSLMPAKPIDRIRDLYAALALRDPHSAAHSQRTAQIAVAMGAGMNPAELYVLAVASLLHDIGKLSIPMRILNFKGRLSAEDWTRMQGHSAMSARLVRMAGLPLGDEIALAVRHHHENVDGSGYPDGLAGEQISLAGRIICLADAYDAISSARAYHRDRTHDETMGILSREVGRKCDAGVFERFRHEVEPCLRQSWPWPDEDRAVWEPIEAYLAAQH